MGTFAGGLKKNKIAQKYGIKPGYVTDIFKGRRLGDRKYSEFLAEYLKNNQEKEIVSSEKNPIIEYDPQLRNYFIETIKELKEENKKLKDQIDKLSSWDGIERRKKKF